MSDRKRRKEEREEKRDKKRRKNSQNDEDDEEKYSSQTAKLSEAVQKLKHVETFYEKPPPGLIKEEEVKPEDCIPDAPGNEDARDFLAHAPTKGLWMPLGKEVKVMQCWRCKRFGHRTGDRECPFFIKGNQKIEQFRVAHEDPMYDIIRENKRNEKETRIEQLKQLLQDTTSDSDSSSSSSHHGQKKKKKEKKKKKKKKKQKKKRKHKSNNLCPVCAAGLRRSVPGDDLKPNRSTNQRAEEEGGSESISAVCVEKRRRERQAKRGDAAAYKTPRNRSSSSISGGRPPVEQDSIQRFRVLHLHADLDFPPQEAECPMLKCAARTPSPD
ncbi:Retinitis pigmentosa 9 protein [Bagarius yarrelli]|uniref:Retinitis pigmentosa 9 protein n=1 Tax=Bagarius yarrelli TaxID=175774 RepID=A0A556TPN1_BAGYA|nr:Retinitis pigmentosa 9 protein [Bagarius yarrelli]